jgi:hypothetical protein
MDELEKLKSALAKVNPEDIHLDDDDHIKITPIEDSVNLGTVPYLVNKSALTSYTYGANHNSYGSITIASGGSGYSPAGQVLSNNGASPMWTSNVAPSKNPSISVTGDAEFEGDIKVKGVSIAKALEDIQNRLAIPIPDPKKLEHFESLKKAYDHYKTLEALCQLPVTDKK